MTPRSPRFFDPATCARRRRLPRHPAEVTSDRLGDHLERWYDRADGREQDAISTVRDWLDRIANDDEAVR